MQLRFCFVLVFTKQLQLLDIIKYVFIKYMFVFVSTNFSGGGMYCGQLLYINHRYRLTSRNDFKYIFLAGDGVRLLGGKVAEHY